jgi:hypothetical protein
VVTNNRLGDFLGRRVLDNTGTDLGRVHDVRLRKDGPIIPGFGPAYRVEGLLVGPRSFAARLGFDRPDITGPWPFDIWGRRAARRALFIAAGHVTDNGDVLQCDQRRDELQPAHQ